MARIGTATRLSSPSPAPLPMGEGLRRIGSVADEAHAVDDRGEIHQLRLARDVHRDHGVLLEELGDLRVAEAEPAQHLRADDAADAHARAGLALDLVLVGLQAALAADAAEPD